MAGVLSDRELALVDAYWRAANYVSVGQIYLLDNPLLREPLQLRHVKPRLLGHWGTTPGLNFVYVHLNRVIRKFDLDTLYICGPGHGGPAMVAGLEHWFVDIAHGFGDLERVALRTVVEQRSRERDVARIAVVAGRGG